LQAQVYETMTNLRQSTSSVVRLSRRADWADGQPISELMSRALADPHLISLAAGFVDQQSLPVEPTRLALADLMSDDDAARAALQYGTTAGFPPLREALLQQFQASNGGEQSVGIDQVVVTAGSNQLLHLVSESLLDPGDIVICSSPTYLVYLGTLANLGARSIGVAMDKDGMIPEALDELLASLARQGLLPRIKAIYLVPYFDNPCGVSLPLERRHQIVQLAKRWSHTHQIHVIADEAYRELRYDGHDIPSTSTVDEDGKTVIVAGTFSKSFSPGIRIGWGILPAHLVDPVCNQKGNIDFGSPNFSQHLMARVLAMDLFRPHVSRIRVGYRQKLESMLTAADEHLAGIDGVRWIHPQGGLYVWVTLPEEISANPDGALFESALREGVLYVPGQFCYPSEGETSRKNTLRLSFGVQSPQKIEQGMAALARAIKEVTASKVPSRTPA
jgi:2-aminoadipate transaminase